MSSQFDQVSVVKKSNIYFDGKCVSHSVLFADGSQFDSETLETLDYVCHFG